MALDNVHPEVLARLQRQLPDGATVLSITSADGASSTVIIDYSGALRQAIMPKVSLLEILSDRVVTVPFSEGVSVGDAVKEIANKYHLELVEGIDYDVSGQIISFGGAASVQLVVPILPTSVSLAGALIFTAVNLAMCGRSEECVKTELGESRTRLALSGKVFPGDGTLTPEFCRDVANFASSLKLEVEFTVGEFMQGEILHYLEDSTSQLLIVRFPSGTILPIRWS